MSPILAGWLLLASIGPERMPTADTRAGIIAGYRLVLTANDHDGDGRLSRAEWTAMVSVAFPERPRETPAPENYAQLRASMLAFYAGQDRNGDGYLDLRELVREPLAHFACADRNRDGRATRREQWRAMSHSPAIIFDFASEAPARPTSR